MSSFTSILPDFVQSANWSVWGASGFLLKTLHHDGFIPFWACMSLTNILVRTSLIPVVIKSAHTSARLANVAPEVQFLVSSFLNDYKRLKDQGAGLKERRFLFQIAWKTLRKIYQLHKVNPLDVFKVSFCLMSFQIWETVFICRIQCVL
jgi:membrane protein insertase Oxa1/YidC/SpoIIIJ